jgi:hypothetical protein
MNDQGFDSPRRSELNARELMTDLINRNELSNDLVLFLVEQGLIGDDPNSIVRLDGSTWQAENLHDGAIRVGTQPVPASIKNRYMFEGLNHPKTVKEEITYKMIHEFVHKLTNLFGKKGSLQDSHFNDLLLIAKQMSDGGGGLTAWSSIYDTSNKRLEKPLEDVVELLTMGIWDRDYLQSYLDFCESTSEPYLARYGIIKLSDRSSYEYLSNSLKGVFDRLSAK